MKTYQEAMDGLAEALKEHNEAVGTQGRQIMVDEVLRKVREEGGGTTLRYLREIREADLVQYGVLPAIARRWLKDIAEKPAVRESSEVFREKHTVVVRDASDEIADASDADLIARYNHANPGRVGEALKLRAGGAAFLIFVDGKLDVDASAKRLDRIRRGLAVLHTVTLDDGRAVRPLAVGDPLVREVERENFLYPGQALADGVTCTHTKRDLSNIPREVQQLCYVAVTIGELTISSEEIARIVIERAQRPDALVEMRRDYPRAALVLAETPKDRWPTLELDVARAGARPGRPFADPGWKDGQVRVAIYGNPGDPLISSLVGHLANVKRLADVWHLGMVPPGAPASEWGVARLRSAHVVIVWLTPDLFDSHEEASTVVDQLRAGGVSIVPVLARPCDVSASSIARLQVLPRNRLPVASYADPDEALVEVACAVRQIVEWLARAAGLASVPTDRATYNITIGGGTTIQSLAVGPDARADAGPNPREDRAAVLARLCGMLPAQFERVVFKFNLAAVIPGSSAPQATRAVEVVRYLEQCGRLHEV